MGVVFYGSNNTFIINGSIYTGLSSAITASSTLTSPTTGTQITVNTGGVLNTAGHWTTVNVNGDAAITNYGTISNTGGGYAIEIGAGSTVTNYGTISGNVSFYTSSPRFMATSPGGSTLEIGTGSSISGTVLAQGVNNTLRLAGTGTGSFDAGTIGSSQAYQGFDTFEKSGTGTWTLTGTGTQTQGWAVKAGTLAVNATLPAVMTVMSGATLQGIGTVAGIDSSGVVAPGNSIGTLSVTGAYTQRATGTLQIELSPSAADKLVVGGAASLDGTLQVIPQAGSYSTRKTFPIITAQSVSGTFKTVTVSNASNLGGAPVNVQYQSNEVDLVIGADSATQQSTTNSVVGQATDRLSTRLITTSIGNHISAIMFPPDFAKKKRLAADAGTPSGLSGGDAAKASAYEPHGLASWADASLALLDNTDSATKYNGLHKTATLGTDFRIGDSLVAGLAAAPEDSRINLKATGGSTQSTGATISAYGGYKFDDTYAVTLMGGMGRVLKFNHQPIGGVWVDDSFGSNRYFAQINGSAAYMVQDDLRVTPSLAYTHTMEASSGHYSSDGANVDVRATRIGTIKAATQVEYAVQDNLVPFLLGAIERDVISSDRNRTGYAFGGGVQMPLDDNLTLGAVATTNFGRAAQSETQFAANIRYSW